MKMHRLIGIPFCWLAIYAAAGIFASNNPASAQSDCGRRLMLDSNATGARNVYTEACKDSIQENKSIQQQAQARIEARTRWNALEPGLKSCLDDAFKLEGSSIEFKIRDGIIPNFENTVGYLNARKIKC